MVKTNFEQTLVVFMLFALHKYVKKLQPGINTSLTLLEIFLLRHSTFNLHKNVKILKPSINTSLAFEFFLLRTSTLTFVKM